MSKPLKNKVALVTGGSRGIGAAIVRRLAKEGAHVAFTYSASAKAAAAVAREAAGFGVVAKAYRADSAAPRTLPRLVSRVMKDFGRIDVLVNNAGGMLGRVRIEDYTVEHVDRVLALNCTQVALFMREVIPGMRRKKSGNVINVTSIAARHGGGGGAILYAGAKGFVSAVTHGWAKEVVGDGIRVNAVSPGVITTPFHDRYSTPAQLQAMQATIPMNRLGTADECAGTFLYLASDALSGYVTGQVIEVNGGQLMP